MHTVVKVDQNHQSAAVSSAASASTSGRASKSSQSTPRGSTSSSSIANSKKCELLFFPRNHLDNGSLLHTHRLHHTSCFYAMDVQDHFLLVQLSGGQFLIYKLAANIFFHQESQPVPYRATPHAHENLGADDRIVVTLELLYIVDCSEATPLSTTPNAGVPIIQPPLPAFAITSPPLQTRLWLHQADPLRITKISKEETKSAPAVHIPSQPAPSSTNPSSSNSSTFSLSSLHSGRGAWLWNVPVHVPASSSSSSPANLHSSKGKKRRTKKTLSIVLLTSSGHLIVVDVGSRAQLLGDSINDSAALRVSPSRGGRGADDVNAWLRIIGSGFVSFWLHDMASQYQNIPQAHFAFYYIPCSQCVKRPQLFDGNTVNDTGSKWQPNQTQIQHVCDSHFTRRKISKRVIHGVRLFSYGPYGLEVWFRKHSKLQSNAASATSLSPSPSPLPGTALSPISKSPPLLPSTAHVHAMEENCPAALEANRLSEFDAEVTPLGLDSHIGVVVGITKGLRSHAAGLGSSSVASTPIAFHHRRHSLTQNFPGYSSTEWLAVAGIGGPGPFYRLQSKLQPYLHSVLAHLVTSANAVLLDGHPGPDIQYAIELANWCRSHEYFSVALELLLHTALSASSSSSPSTALSRVVAFLRRFPEFPDIVVSCARKNDSVCWSRLFHLSGDPSQLFDSCLKAGNLRTASKYLLVIQRMVGMKEAHDAAKRLLDVLSEDSINPSLAQQEEQSLLQQLQIADPLHPWASRLAVPFFIGGGGDTAGALVRVLGEDQKLLMAAAFSERFDWERDADDDADEDESAVSASSISASSASSFSSSSPSPSSASSSTMSHLSLFGHPHVYYQHRRAQKKHMKAKLELENQIRRFLTLTALSQLEQEKEKEKEKEKEREKEKLKEKEREIEKQHSINGNRVTNTPPKRPSLPSPVVRVRQAQPNVSTNANGTAKTEINEAAMPATAAQHHAQATGGGNPPKPVSAAQHTALSQNGHEEDDEGEDERRGNADGDASAVGGFLSFFGSWW